MYLLIPGSSSIHPLMLSLLSDAMHGYTWLCMAIHGYAWLYYILGLFGECSGTAPRHDQVCLLLITAVDTCDLQTGLPVNNALASAN